MKRHPVFCLVLLVTMLNACSKRGQLASPAFDKKPIRGILYFAGEQLDGKVLPQNLCSPGGCPH